MEKAEYKIGGIEYYQTELTWKQDKQLIRLYNRVHAEAFRNDEITIKDLQPLLTKYNLLHQFFAVVLHPKITLKYILSFKWISYYLMGSIELNAATNSDIGKIFQDFFLLNLQLGMKLKELMNALGLIADQAEKIKKNKA